MDIIDMIRLRRIMDYGICSKSRIISYLDFFIQERMTNEKMLNAIQKRESDREFVKQYKEGSFKKVWMDVIDFSYNWDWGGWPEMMIRQDVIDFTL